MDAGKTEGNSLFLGVGDSIYIHMENLRGKQTQRKNIPQESNGRERGEQRQHGHSVPESLDLATAEVKSSSLTLLVM